MLHGELLSFVTEVKNTKTILQRNNASIHTAATMKMWFQDFGIELLAWSALSPNLNSIEDLSGILARKVYDQEQPSIEDIVELKRTIKFAWDIQNGTLNKLANSVPNKFIEVIKNNKERSTEYWMKR